MYSSWFVPRCFIHFYNSINFKLHSFMNYLFVSLFLFLHFRRVRFSIDRCYMLVFLHFIQFYFSSAHVEFYINRQKNKKPSTGGDYSGNKIIFNLWSIFKSFNISLIFQTIFLLKPHKSHKNRATHFLGIIFFIFLVAAFWNTSKKEKNKKNKNKKWKK